MRTTARNRPRPHHLIRWSPSHFAASANRASIKRYIENQNRHPQIPQVSRTECDQPKLTAPRRGSSLAKSGFDIAKTPPQTTLVKIMKAEVSVELCCPLVDRVDNHRSGTELAPTADAATKPIDQQVAAETLALLAAVNSQPHPAAHPQSNTTRYLNVTASLTLLSNVVRNHIARLTAMGLHVTVEPAAHHPQAQPRNDKAAQSLQPAPGRSRVSAHLGTGGGLSGPEDVKNDQEFGVVIDPKG